MALLPAERTVLRSVLQFHLLVPVWHWQPLLHHCNRNDNKILNASTKNPIYSAHNMHILWSLTADWFVAISYSSSTITLLTWCSSEIFYRLAALLDLTVSTHQTTPVLLCIQHVISVNVWMWQKFTNDVDNCPQLKHPWTNVISDNNQ